MLVRIGLLISLMCGSVFAAHTDQVRYSILLNYNKGRLFADLKQTSSIHWSMAEVAGGARVIGAMTVTLPEESYKIDENDKSGPNWKRIDEHSFSIEMLGSEFTTPMSLWRKDPKTNQWDKVTYDLTISLDRSTLSPFVAMGNDCERAGLRLEMPGVKRIPYVVFQCSTSETDDLIVDISIPKNWNPKLSNALEETKPKSEDSSIHLKLPVIPRKTEKDWGDFILSSNDYDVHFRIKQVPAPKKPPPYPPSRWQIGMMFDYLVFSENPEVGAINWAGLRLDVDHRWRMFHRFFDWNFHAFLNQSFTYRITPSSDFPIGFLWGASLGAGPAFKNKWQKAFWTLHLGAYAYGMFSGSGNYGFDYLIGPYLDLVIRIPHGDVNIRRGVVVQAKWSVLTESPTQWNFANKHLQFNLEYWFNANWAVRGQFDSLYYQSLANVNQIQWSNYGLGVVYAP